MSNDDLRLLEMTLWVYVTIAAIVGIVILVGYAVISWVDHRRTRRILGRGK